MGWHGSVVMIGGTVGLNSTYTPWSVHTVGSSMRQGGATVCATWMMTGMWMMRRTLLNPDFFILSLQW